MAAPIDIYYLVRLADDPPVGDAPYLLLKITQAGFGNWSQSQEDAAVAEVLHRRDQLIANFLSQAAAPNPRSPTTAEVVGEFQGFPIGDVFDKQADHPSLDIWVAATGFGSYWIVLGVAPTEEAFWRQIAEDEEAASLEPTRPARRMTVHFLNRTDGS